MYLYDERCEDWYLLLAHGPVHALLISKSMDGRPSVGGGGAKLKFFEHVTGGYCVHELAWVCVCHCAFAR